MTLNRFNAKSIQPLTRALTRDLLTRVASNETLTRMPTNNCAAAVLIPLPCIDATQPQCSSYIAATLLLLRNRNPAATSRWVPPFAVPLHLLVLVCPPSGRFILGVCQNHTALRKTKKFVEFQYPQRGPALEVSGGISAPLAPALRPARTLN